MSTSGNEPLSQRVGDLEWRLTHLQYDYEQINALLLDQQARIERLTQAVARLEALLSAEPLPDAADERPPHY